VALEALTLQEAFPRHASETTATDVVALHVPSLYVEQVPVAFPKLAKKTLLNTSPAGHLIEAWFPSCAIVQIVEEAAASWSRLACGVGRWCFAGLCRSATLTTNSRATAAAAAETRRVLIVMPPC